jgi:hypothetical protein
VATASDRRPEFYRKRLARYRSLSHLTIEIDGTTRAGPCVGIRFGDHREPCKPRSASFCFPSLRNLKGTVIDVRPIDVFEMQYEAGVTRRLSRFRHPS